MKKLTAHRFWPDATVLSGMMRKCKNIILYLACALTVFWLSAMGAFAQQQNDTVDDAQQQNDMVDEDGLATDITVSLLSVAPGYTVYTAHGHCALRLQCPSAGLDYSFTYGLDDTVENRLAFFTGEAKGEYSAVQTHDYLQEYANEGRRVVEYELNLNLYQKRRLWELLDNEVSYGAVRPYNYLTTNCSSMCAFAVKRALQGEAKMVYGSASPILNGTYRDFVHVISRHRPWVDFFWNSLLGSEGDKVGQNGEKYSPSLLVETWKHASIVDKFGSRRPLLIDSNGSELISGDDGQHTSWFTPTICFALLLLLVILLSVAEHTGHLHKLAFTVDATLMLLLTVIGMALCYMTLFSSLDGSSGNWYALVFNPLPLLAWLLFRKNKRYVYFYLFYFSFLLVFIMFTPFVAQIDMPHSLMISMLAVRCLSNAWRMKYKTDNSK